MTVLMGIVPLAVQLIRVSRLWALGAVTRQVIAIVDDVRE